MKPSDKLFNNGPHEPIWNHMKQFDLVKIVWRDAFAGPSGWISLEDYDPKEVLPCTVGWLIPDVLDGYLTTADTYYIDDDGSPELYNIGHIPKEMVISIEVVEIPDKLSRRARRKGDK